MRKSKFLVFRALIYSIFHSPRAAWLQITGKIQARGVFMSGVKLKISKNAQLIIGAGTYLRNVKIEMREGEGRLRIGENSHFRNAKIAFYGNENCGNVIFGNEARVQDCEIATFGNGNAIFGNDFSMEGGSVLASENSKIAIGDDCMFSVDVEIRSGDALKKTAHPIFLLPENKRFNEPKNIIVGNHVWICAHARVLKGTIIGNGSIIGLGAIASGNCSKENAIYAGVPAKIVKENIRWER